MNNINNLLHEHGITEYGIIDFEKLTVINPKLLPNTKVQSVIITLLPYRTGNTVAKDGYNMGLFARIKDYHAVFNRIADMLIPKFKRLYGGDVFFFADHSPIFEKEAAAKCGLGFIGRNSLLINSKYGSFVFIGCFLFSEKLEERLFECEVNCGQCNRCIEACPANAISKSLMCVNMCLSGISQKKKKNEDELNILQQTKTVWGCDICQSVCPYNKNAALSTVYEFDSVALESISAEIIEQMEETEYKQFAFSFRPKKVIAENLLTANGKRDIIEKD
ncbi:MAG: epoxyqueuosine reductase [Clostridia bacterium]|nr:epoxyqueuosine reductase [Clostridia bacterium]